MSRPLSQSPSVRSVPRNSPMAPSLSRRQRLQACRLLSRRRVPARWTARPCSRLMWAPARSQRPRQETANSLPQVCHAASISCRQGADFINHVVPLIIWSKTNKLVVHGPRSVASSHNSRGGTRLAILAFVRARRPTRQYLRQSCRADLEHCRLRGTVRRPADAATRASGTSPRRRGDYRHRRRAALPTSQSRDRLE